MYRLEKEKQKFVARIKRAKPKHPYVEFVAGSGDSSLRSERHRETHPTEFSSHWRYAGLPSSIEIDMHSGTS